MEALDDDDAGGTIAVGVGVVERNEMLLGSGGGNGGGTAEADHTLLAVDHVEGALIVPLGVEVCPSAPLTVTAVELAAGVTEDSELEGTTGGVPVSAW
jgi:hypothetical protein